MIIREAFRALARNKMRSILTMLGVIIGAAAFITMVSISQGANSSIQASIASLGRDLLFVLPGTTTAGGVRSAAGSSMRLTVEDARAITHEAETVKIVSYARRAVLQIVSGNRNWHTSVTGVSPDFFPLRDWDAKSGRVFTWAEDGSAAKVAVLGQTVVENLFGRGQDPVGQTIRVKRVPLRVIGVLKPKGQSPIGQDQDDVVFIPFSTAEKRVIGARILGRVSIILASASDSASVSEAQEQIDRILRRRHRLRPGEEPDFTIRTMEDIARTAAGASRIMTILLASVASVSLIVGGIGIMNIMLVSVTERTREIGLRMAVGAKGSDILLQFLVEALVLSVIGGIIGIIVGLMGSKSVSALAGWPTMFTPWAIGTAFLFSALVGIFFGFYPARRASGLDPIECLRYE